MSMAKQIFYYNLKKGNKVEVEIYNRNIRPYYEKNQLNYWQSEEFLNRYLQKLIFEEPYAGAYGSIATGWVTNPWKDHMSVIVNNYIKSYLNKHRKLPEGKVIFTVNWKKRKPKWLQDFLKKEQVVTFPELRNGPLE